jgi:hypothetical protein
MPALSGEIIQTLRDGSGQTVIEAVIFYTPDTGALRDSTYTTSQGPQTGALIVDNRTGRQVRVVVKDSSGTELRSVNIPSGGLTRTTAQMATLGVTNISQLNGMTFDLA